MSNILPYQHTRPGIDNTAFIGAGAQVIGDIVIGAKSSIWYNCVLRGDVNIIRIGRDTNIQDGTVIHVATRGNGTHIGDRVTVGHMALLHDCVLEDDSFVGMGAIVMDGARVESGGMLAAGGMLTPGKVVPMGELWSGRPARFMRKKNDEDNALTTWSWKHYVTLAKQQTKNL